MLASIEWPTKEEGGRAVLPTGDGPLPYCPLVRFPDDPSWPGPEADWSFEIWKSGALGSPDRWIADVGFLVEAAPHEEVRAGRDFELSEGRKRVARGRLVGDAVNLANFTQGATTA